MLESSLFIEYAVAIAFAGRVLFRFPEVVETLLADMSLATVSFTAYIPPLIPYLAGLPRVDRSEGTLCGSPHPHG